MSLVTPEQLVTIIDQYAYLVRTGDYYLGHCPVCHAVERMVVRPNIGQWHCYGCGAGGDIIDFVRAAEHVDTESARARVEALLAAEPAPAPLKAEPAPAQPEAEQASAGEPFTGQHEQSALDGLQQSALDGLLERLSGMKGFAGAAAFYGQIEVSRGEPLNQAGEVMQLLATMLASAHQVLGEPGEPFGMVVMRHEGGKLMLVEGELSDGGYSVLLSLTSEANEAMAQLTVRSYLSRLAAEAV